MGGKRGPSGPPPWIRHWPRMCSQYECRRQALYVFCPTERRRPCRRVAFITNPVIRRVHNRVSNNNVRRAFYLHDSQLLSTRTLEHHIDCRYLCRPNEHIIHLQVLLTVDVVARDVGRLCAIVIFEEDSFTCLTVKKKSIVKVKNRTGPRRYYAHFHFLGGNDTEEFGVETTRVPVSRVNTFAR